MNQLTIIPMEDRTPEQQEAVFMHEQVSMHKNMLVVGLSGICYDLKVIRDRSLYTHLGFDTFEAYTEQAHGIGKRQAYNYIRLIEQYGQPFLQSTANAEIGITKLLEIATLDYEGKQKVLETYTPEELSDKSTTEVKALVAEIANLKKQLGMFDEESKKEEATMAGQEYEDEAHFEEMLEAAIAVERDRIRQEALADARAESEARIDEFKSKADEATKAKKEATDKLKDMESMARIAKSAEQKALEEAKLTQKAVEEAVTLKAELDRVTADKKAIEAKIKMSINPELARFRYMLEQLQTDLKAIIVQYNKLDDESRPKMKTALEALLGGIKL